MSNVITLSNNSALAIVDKLADDTLLIGWCKENIWYSEKPEKYTGSYVLVKNPTDKPEFFLNGPQYRVNCEIDIEVATDYSATNRKPQACINIAGRVFDLLTEAPVDFLDGEEQHSAHLLSSKVGVVKVNPATKRWECILSWKLRVN